MPQRNKKGSVLFICVLISTSHQNPIPLNFGKMIFKIYYFKTSFMKKENLSTCAAVLRALSYAIRLLM